MHPDPDIVHSDVQFGRRPDGPARPGLHLPDESRMTTMTRQQGDLLRRLIALAGDPEIVQVALQQLNREAAAPPTLEQLMVRILELRNERDRAVVRHPDATPESAAPVG